MTEIDICWLCERPLGQKVEWHHPVPKSKGGKETVPLHPICHRTIHATFNNTELERAYNDRDKIADQEDISRFLKWIVGKPADFHAPTRRRK